MSMAELNGGGKTAKKGGKRALFVLMCVGAFTVSFVASAVFKLTAAPAGLDYSTAWDDTVGTVHTDIPYGEGAANRFDLYLPADTGKASYGLVVYLHAGGFTSGDKADDVEMLRWLCAKGYVAAGINYTLFSEEHPEASVYSQSQEIKQSMPVVVAQAAQLGYNIGGMAVAGGSAGGTLALLYGYRDAKDAPVPVKLVFEAVGPSSFFPQDWQPYGLDQSPEAAAGLFSVMAGTAISPEIIDTPEYNELIKPISAYMWVDASTPPTVCAYGRYDKICPYDTVKHLVCALEENHVPHEYIEFAHSGHGLQNDNAEYAAYMAAVEEYLERYLPVDGQ